MEGKKQKRRNINIISLPPSSIVHDQTTLSTDTSQESIKYLILNNLKALQRLESEEDEATRRIESCPMLCVSAPVTVANGLVTLDNSRIF